MSSTARLILDPPQSGSRNMAVDQAILEQSAIKPQMTLRFYRWTPATISLGYFQGIETRKSHSFSSECPLVRRATGGGAIVHDRELTYSLCVPQGTFWASDNQRLYQLVHRSLIEQLKTWNVDAELVPETRKQKPEPFLCFQRRAEGDVICQGHKVCGSAQRRVEKSILQHGSILLDRSDAAPELPGINDLSQESINDKILAASLTVLLQEKMGVQFDLTLLSQEEEILAEQIEQDRFCQDRWNAKR